MKTEHVNILLVDTHAIEASKVKAFLEQHSELPFCVSHCASRSTALQVLKGKSTKVDAIILDLFLIDPTNPKETYKLIHDAAGDTPIIVMTGRKGHALACEVTAEGASAVVVRERFEADPTRLLDAIEFSLIRANLLRELKENNAEEIRYHKQMLHWMTGGYSMEAESEPIIKTAKDKNAA